MHVAVKTTHIYHLFGNVCSNLKKKNAPGHMREGSISFHCAALNRRVQK